MTKASYIVAARRSAVAPRGGALANIGLHELATPVIEAVLKDAGVATNQVDQIIAGNALGAGGNPARLIALAAGLEQTVSGISIDSQCCSGLDAVSLADSLVRSNQASVVLAGGVESYSQRPQRFQKNNDTGELEPYEQAPFTPWPHRNPDMAEAAHTLAVQLGITAHAQNQWAIDSHRKALNAAKELETEIVSIADAHEDSFTRNLTLATCQRAAPVFESVSTANMAVAADASAFVLVVSPEIAKQLRVPKQRILQCVSRGANPEMPGLAPIEAVRHVLKQQGVSAKEIAHCEVMEAFAAQAIACVEQCGIDPDICNKKGGALARGHPIAASGAILLTRLYNDWRSEYANKPMSNQSGLSLATIAGAGGIATAILLENVNG